MGVVHGPAHCLLTYGPTHGSAHGQAYGATHGSAHDPARGTAHGVANDPPPDI